VASEIQKVSQRGQKSISVYNQQNKLKLQISEPSSLQCSQPPQQNYRQSSKHISQVEFFDENVKANAVPKITPRRSNDRYSDYQQKKAQAKQ
jgi:hypothetical protein